MRTPYPSPFDYHFQSEHPTFHDDQVRYERGGASFPAVSDGIESHSPYSSHTHLPIPHPNFSGQPLSTTYDETAESDSYYATLESTLYQPYEPDMLRIGGEPPLRPVPTRLPEEEPTQITYEDTLAANLLVQMALIGGQDIRVDEADDAVLPASPASLVPSTAGLESLLGSSRQEDDPWHHL